MRTVLALSFLSLCSIHSSFAADAVLPEIAPSTNTSYEWSGFYLGANGGYSWTGIDTTENSITTSGALVGIEPGSFDPPSTFSGADRSANADGGFGGVQVGYNWQQGSWVYGAEADYQYGSLLGSDSFLGTVDQGPSYETSAELRHFGTVRGRIGYAFDDILIYGTGGLAVGHLETVTSVTGGLPDTPTGPTFTASESHTLVGYTIGAGVEAAIARSNWTIKGEYLFADFGGDHVDLSFPDSDGSTASARTSVDMNIVRVGINYRF